MSLPKKAVKQFSEIYYRLYKIKLTDREAVRRSGNLIALYKAIYGGDYFGQIKNLENANGKNNQ